MLLLARELAQDIYYELHLHKKKADGMCAIASARLFEVLKGNGFEVAIHRIQGGPNWGHCFVVVKVDCRWHVIDITYTQFDPFAPNILVEPYGQYKLRIKDGPGKEGGYTEKWTSDLKHFRQRFLAGWPNFQKPPRVREFACEPAGV